MRIAVIGLPFYALCVALGLPLLDLALSTSSMRQSPWRFRRGHGRYFRRRARLFPLFSLRADCGGGTRPAAAAVESGSSAYGIQSGLDIHVHRPFRIHPSEPHARRIRQAISSLREYFPHELIGSCANLFSLLAAFDGPGAHYLRLTGLDDRCRRSSSCSAFPGCHVQTIRSAEYLQVGTYRDLPGLATYIPIRKVGGALGSRGSSSRRAICGSGEL